MPAGMRSGERRMSGGEGGGEGGGGRGDGGGDDGNGEGGGGGGGGTSFSLQYMTCFIQVPSLFRLSVEPAR